MQTTLAPSYSLIIEINYTAKEAAMVEQLRTHIANVEKDDVRDFRESVMLLFNPTEYLVGCGSGHIWVVRRSNPIDRLLFIGSMDACIAASDSLEKANKTPKCLSISA